MTTTSRPGDRRPPPWLKALEAAERQPMVAGSAGVVRLEVAGERRTRGWDVVLEDGRVRVGPRGDEAVDAVMRADRRLLEGAVSGRANAMAAVLRGAIEVDGDLALALALQRLFPGPPRAAGSAS